MTELPKDRGGSGPPPQAARPAGSSPPKAALPKDRGGSGPPPQAGRPAGSSPPKAALPGAAKPAAHVPQDQPPTGADGMIVCDRLIRIYTGKGIEVQALQGLDLLIAEGELTAVIGAAGSGKSTLMNILAGLDTPTAGSVWVAGRNLGAMTAKQRLAYRRSVTGFIWQQTSRNLLPYMTARQNVLLPMRLSSLGRQEQRRRAGFLLDSLGIAYCADRTPDRMSGGEQQRAAIATALANQPKVLLADEPTGELDSSTARDVFAALQTANTELGATVLVVTHDPAVSSQVRRTIAIRDGKTSSETIRHAATDEGGMTTLHAREYATLDRAGRVQLPREMTRRLGMRNRVELQEEPDHIGVWPDQAADQERE
jgi:lipoprotein-releasing system ATP-binding protein